MATIDELRSVPLFQNLSEEQLGWLRDHAMDVYLKVGEILFSEGDSPHGLYISLSGEIQITKHAAEGEEVVLAVRGSGNFVGEISLLTGEPHNASIVALADSHFVRFDAEAFSEMLRMYPSVTNAILQAVAERLRNTEVQIRQREKLAALGTMAAGLAHQLNNPASAAARAAKQLRETLVAAHGLVMRLNQLNLAPSQTEYLADFQAAYLANPIRPKALDPLAQSDREDELSAWLEAHYVDNAWNLAPTFVSAGLTVEQLDDMADHIGLAALNDVVVWLEATLTGGALVYTLEQSTSRISDLVKAFKGYSYMDQAPIQDLDIHDGLENTLVILGHKLKGINVIREYDRTLPHIEAFGSELNQVWTNLIENAIDALEGKGRIWVRTFHENDQVVVEIIDDGPGIPPEVRPRIFEPFFTTKGVGKGTGLGLSIIYRIVVTEHHGSMDVESEPGRTCFRVRLPLRHEQTAQNTAVQPGAKRD
jgi:signal transduction histidine kinase